MPAGHRPVPRVTRCGATASDPGRCHRAGGVKGSMDHFERELARMMRDTQEYTPFEPAQQDRLRTGVLVRRRVRAAQKAVGSVLVAAGLGVGLVLLPHAPDRD